MTTTEQNWLPDPTGRYEYRWWDGTTWTDQVSNQGQPSTDPLEVALPPPQQQQPGPPPPSEVGGSIFTELVLVVNQKVKLIEVHNEYAVFDQNGNQLAAVRQIGQNALKKFLRVVTSLDQFMSHTLQIVDRAGNVQMTLHRPAKFVKSRIDVADGNGSPVGSIVQQNAIGKIRFNFEVEGRVVGSIRAQNWRAWNFTIHDHDDTEIAKITKTWEGLLKTAFTTADNYVVNIHGPLQQPLLGLVVASALSVDTALKQDSRGLN